MNTYRLIVRGVGGEGGLPGPSSAHEDRTLYAEADSPAAAGALFTARGFILVSVQAVSAADVPAGAGVQRVPVARVQPNLLRDNAGVRRTVYAMIGVGLGIVVIVGAVFVMRAREHLTRSDIQPRVPAGEFGGRPLTPPARGE